jgi:1-deoxy-D-xylulose-5-phosphate reductoisomerase
MQRVAVLGATGSIGGSALVVIARHPGAMRASLLAAGRNVAALVALCAAHRPEHAVIGDESALPALRDGLRAAGCDTVAHAGHAALSDLVAGDGCDTVVAAIVGAAGLESTLAAARAGKRLLLANKESLVLAGELLMQAAHAGGATIVPVDSEHNAIFQCLPQASPLGVEPPGVRRILLTASGGPFRDWSAAALENVTPEQACAHPVWSMGRKISVDSATLMNKGLELIEAALLFGLPPERIEVVIHRQSVVHSLVEYEDGSVLAQLGSPDMRTPIAHALAWPERIPSGVQFLDLLRVGRLDFEAPDTNRFPCLALATEAARAGGEMPAVLNAANEVAVGAFLAGQLDFMGIAETCAAVMKDWGRVDKVQELAGVLAADARARALASGCVARHAARA